MQRDRESHGSPARVAAEQSWPALDFDQEQSLRRENEQVDLVDAAVIGDELKIRPGSIRLVRRKPVAPMASKRPRELALRGLVFFVLCPASRGKTTGETNCVRSKKPAAAASCENNEPQVF